MGMHLLNYQIKQIIALLMTYIFVTMPNIRQSAQEAHFQRQIN